jgi:glutaredoxin
MSWNVKDEFLDLARGRHVVIFHNSDTKAEHHLIHEFNLSACPHCGDVKQAAAPIDFAKLKAETHEKLSAHHRSVMQYRSAHPQVELRSGPKK